MMEDKDSIIAQLRNEIRARDEEIHLAATYGKQLCDEKLQMSSKIEVLFAEKEKLEQEKHSLQLALEAQIKTVRSQTSELELQRGQADSISEKFEITEKKIETLHTKNRNITKDNEFLKKALSDLNIENKSLKDKINLLEAQVKNFEEQAEKSLCEIEKDDSVDLHSQLNTYMLNNKELQDALSKSQYELEVAKKNENQLLQMVHELEETIAEKNSEISTLHIEMENAKEEIEELQCEIEVFKFDQVDVNRRGNSVFAELDDRRNLVEREYKILRKKYDQFQKDYEENVKELDKARGQMAILQSMVSRDYQQAYIDKLEDSLASARREVSDLMHKFTKAVKELESVEERTFSEKNEYDYLRVMLKQLQQREKELQTEVVNLTSKNIYDNDKLVETQHHLYKSKADLDAAKQEILKMKQQIKELERGIMRNLPNEPQTSKPKIEVYDGFKPLTKDKENELLNKSLLNKSKFDPFDDLDIIPGELELGEDGFREVKPPRKSNRFKLQEFNRIKTGDEQTVDLSKSICKSSESVGETKGKVKMTHETEKNKLRSHSKMNSGRRNDNCAQQ